jgi:hypothetical protein
MRNRLILISFFTLSQNTEYDERVASFDWGSIISSAGIFSLHKPEGAGSRPDEMNF